MNPSAYNPCYTCRNRRIQCDQTGVPCAKCEKAGLQCLDKRPIRWVKGVAIRGKMQGRSYEPKNGTSSVTGDPDSSSVKSKHSVVKSVARRSNNNDSIPHAPWSIPVAVQDPTLSSLDRISRYYVDYYNDRICKLFIVYDSDRNPFRSLIPLGLTDPVLMKALLALAARHHANAGQPFHQPEAITSPGLVNANRDALSFKHQAMEALSHSLRSVTSSMQDTTVASIFLLIFLDLLESGSDGWNFHLEGAKNLIASTYPQYDSQVGINQGPGQTVQEIRAFITKQIHLIETLGATFLRPRLLSQFTSLNQQELRAQETIEKAFLGCPEYMLTAIQCLSMQRDSISGPKPLDEIAVRSHITETASLLELIETFDSYAWASSLQEPRDSSPQEIANLCKLSQAYKIGTLLYGQRILDALTGEVTAQDALLSELLGLIDSLKDDQDMFKCVLWPVFVAGLECQWQAQRDFLVGSLERFWKITSCLNAVNAAKILREYWDQGVPLGESPSRWIFDIGRLGRDWLWI